YISALWRERSKLTAFGMSFLAVAGEEMKGDRSLLPEILAEVRPASIEQSAEGHYDGSPRGGWSFDSPLRTHASARIAYADETAGADPAMRNKLLAGLLERKRPGWGIWGNTQENVFGIMGVVSTVNHQRTTAGGPKLTLSIDGRAIDASAMQ